MYDRDWARSIVENYQKLCPRAQQIDACLQQLYQAKTGRTCLRHDIKVILIDSLQGKLHQKYWTLYKRLVKKTPLDKELLEKVSNLITCKVDVDKIQRQFDFLDKGS